jgi:hypothetical protein
MEKTMSEKMYELFDAIEVDADLAEQVVYACFNAMNDAQADAVLAEFVDDEEMLG